MAKATEALAVVVILLGAPMKAVSAQQLEAADTAAVFAAVAAAWTATSGTGDAWHVAAGDALTLRFAAAIGQPTRAAPATLSCSFDAPAGAVTGLLTSVQLRVLRADRVLVSVANSCVPTRPSAVGGFRQADHFEVLRRGGVWVARHAFVSIS